MKIFIHSIKLSHYLRQITQKAKAVKRGKNDETANIQDDDCTGGGPSTSAKKVKKNSKKAEAMDDHAEDEYYGEKDMAGPSTSTAKKMKKK